MYYNFAVRKVNSNDCFRIRRADGNFLDAISFSKLLASIKAGRSIDDGDNSQFDERTEESSAEQYFQVDFSPR